MLVYCAVMFNETATTVISTYGPTLSLHDSLPISGGNDGEIDTFVKYAGRRAPWAQDAMKKRVNAWRTDRRLRHEAMVEAAGVFELWKGKATVGGWLTTGNTDKDRKSTRLNSSH